MTPEPFAYRASDAALDDLQARLGRTRWPEAAPPGWAHGTDVAWLRDLVAYWRDGFDWRAQEAWLGRALPGERVRVGELDVHFARIAGRGPRRFPVLLLHGWPSSFVEMHRLAGLLADDGFEVVVPSLPGHGFSSAAGDPAFGADDAADVLRDLMVDVLGHARFGVHGGDRGAFVATGLAHRHRAHVAGIHLSLPLGIPAPASERSADEQAWLDDTARWRASEGGYAAVQSTRPLSLAYGLSDSPVGLAAWILEKWRAWSDCDGDVARCFGRDVLLANVMIYWLTGTIGSSMQYYWAHRVAPPVGLRPERIDVPTGVALFPKEVRARRGAPSRGSTTSSAGRRCRAAVTSRRSRRPTRSPPSWERSFGRSAACDAGLGLACVRALRYEHGMTAYGLGERVDVQRVASMPRSRMLLCVAYAATALVAMVGTWSQNVAYFHTEDGLVAGFALATARFWPDTLTTPAAVSITVDIGLFVLAAAILMLLEARRLGIRFVWLYVVGGLLIAISVTFPLFLIARERRLVARGEAAAELGLGAGDLAGLVTCGLAATVFALWTVGR